MAGEHRLARLGYRTRIENRGMVSSRADGHWRDSSMVRDRIASRSALVFALRAHVAMEARDRGCGDSDRRYNRYRLVPALGERSARATLIRNVTAECLLLGAVLGWSALLTNTPPPH